MSTTEPWTIQRLVRWTTEHFERKGIDSSRLTAEVLLAHALQTNRLKLYLEFDRPLEAGELARFRALVQRRSEGIPTQHLTGGREFYGRLFQVDKRVLIPRPETELLVEATLAAIPGDGTGMKVLDLGVGSGCVSLTLLAERSGLTVAGVELSPEAAEVAKTNAAALNVADRLSLHLGDLWQPLDPAFRWDIIVSNPPYIATAEIAGLAREVRDHDPTLALDGGPDGLAILRRIAAEAGHRLVAGGLLALEIGDDQGPAVSGLLTSAEFKDVVVAKDYAGLDRIVTARGTDRR